MRRKMNEKEKRAVILGIKVKPEIKEKIKYIANREATTISTYINNKLNEEIEKYFQIAKIDWESLTPAERRGEDGNNE